MSASTWTLELDNADVSAQPDDRSDLSAWLWLATWTGTGIARALLWELLLQHAGPATSKSNMVVWIGYAGCLIAALMNGFRKLTQPSFKFWSWGCAAQIGMVYLILNDMVGSSVNAIAHAQAGPLLYAIFHSAMIVFVALITVTWLRIRLTLLQWTGVILVGGSVLVTSVPVKVEARGSFMLGLITALAGNLFHAAQFPVVQRILMPEEGKASPVAESVAFYDSLVGTLVFTTWMLVYTFPRWEEEVYQPILDAPEPSIAWAYFSYLGYMVVEGLHTIAFFASVHRFGAVPVAVSKAITTSGAFIAVHLFFCGEDQTQCINYNHHNMRGWNALQKPVAIMLSLVGVTMYMLGKAKAA